MSAYKLSAAGAVRQWPTPALEEDEGKKAQPRATPQQCKYPAHA